ncbi:cellulose binding domain-containing protein [Phytohabitans sp. LJ34]|uniref:cellulose binding domain-containing protein n=1 Tax=Phytohabitans sp. LJ34 TaxID=3452217 RepID=UPI003F8CCAFC
MGLFNARLVRPARLAAAVVAGIASIAFVPTAARAATADVVKQREWSTGYVGKVTVRNPGPAAITSWRVEFDLPDGTSVADAWDARLTRSGGHYTFANLRRNGDLAPGASTSFGFRVRGTGDPANCTVNAEPCAGPPPLDVTPPSTPVLRSAPLPPSGVLLSWDPSVDDTAVVGYEVFSSSGITIYTTTSTSISLPSLTPADGSRCVRAVDAAGNASPGACFILGHGDTTAPAAPLDLRLAAPLQGYLPVSWAPSWDDVVVLGYEVYLDDVLVTTVGNTKSYVPYSGSGVHKVGVRAYDTMRRFSPMTEVTLAI